MAEATVPARPRAPWRGDPATATLALAGALLAVAALGALALPRDGATLLPGPGGAGLVAAALTLSATLLAGQLGQGVVEVRQRSYGFSLTGVPLLVGLLYLPPLWVIGARLVAAVLAAAVQRTTRARTAHAVAACLLDSVLMATLAHLLLEPSTALTGERAAALCLCLAAVDALMTALLLLVVRIEVGPLRWVDLRVAVVPAAAAVSAASALGMLCVVLLQAGPVGWVLLGLLVGVAGLALRTYLALQRRHRDVVLVQGFVDEGLQGEHGDVRAGEMLARLREILRAETARLVWRTRDGEVQVHLDQRDPGAPAAPLVPPPPGTEGLVPAGTSDPLLRSWLAALGAREALVVDLGRSGGNGLLVLTDRPPGAGRLDATDVRLATALAGHLVVRLRNAELVDRLRWEATHDSLTGLPNRRVLLSALELYLGPRVPVRPGARAPDRESAVLVLVVDRLGEVNDALGHAVGDEVIVEVARRVGLLRLPGATVARMSGEHFGVAVPAVRPGGALALAELLRGVTAEPVTVAHAVLSIGARVGVATAGPGDRDGDRHVDAAELLRRADAALAAARDDGRPVAVFEPAMDSGRTERLALLGDLHRALDEGQVDVLFQPKLDLVHGRVSGVEALCRWEHPVLGTVSPTVFVPVAESAGLVDRLTDLVLATGLRAAKGWQEQGLDLVVAVNLSPRSLDDARLPDRVAAALALAGVGPDRLVLEITETSVMGDPVRTLPVLHALAALGVGLSLDDFGTGYSSLAYLQRLPVHELKIDRSFVMALEDPTATGSVALVRSILALAEGLGLSVVAEGVESARAMAVLRELGCGHVQGFLVSRPVPAGAVAGVVRAVAADPAWAAVPRQRARPRAARALPAPAVTAVVPAALPVAPAATMEA